MLSTDTQCYVYCAFRYVFVDLVFYKGLKLIPYCVDVIVVFVFLYECIWESFYFPFDGVMVGFFLYKKASLGAVFILTGLVVASI